MGNIEWYNDHQISLCIVLLIIIQASIPGHLTRNTTGQPLLIMLYYYPLYEASSWSITYVWPLAWLW